MSNNNTKLPPKPAKKKKNMVGKKRDRGGVLAVWRVRKIPPGTMLKYGTIRRAKINKKYLK